MTKYIISTLIIIGLAGVAYAAPTLIYQKTILPEADSTYNLGSNAVRWANIYGDTFDVTNLTIGNATTTGSMYITNDLTVAGDTHIIDVYLTNQQITGNSTTTGYISAGTDDGYFNFTAGDLNASGELRVGEGATFNGNVGIGTTTPKSLLNLYSSTDDALISFGDSQSNLAHWFAGTDYSDSNKFKIATTSTQLNVAEFTITKDGNVGIGDTSPDAKFEITKTTGNENALFMISSTTDGDLITVKNTGKVGIGTTNPVAKLEIENNTSGAAAYGMYLDNNGDFTGLFIDQISFTQSNTRALDIRVNGDLGGGGGSQGVLIYSNFVHTGGGSLLRVEQDNASANAGPAVFIKQDSLDNGLFIDQNGNGVGLLIDSEATTAANYGLQVVQAGGAYAGLFRQDADAINLKVHKNSAGVGTALDVENDGTGNGLFINQDGNGVSLNIDSEATTADTINIASLGTGDALQITQEGTGRGLFIDQNGETAANNYAGALAIENTGNNRFGLAVYSNNGATQNSGLVQFTSDNVDFDKEVLNLRQDATGAAGTLIVENAGTGNGIFINQNGNGRAIEIDSEATTNAAIHAIGGVMTSASTGVIYAAGTGLITSPIIRVDARNTARGIYIVNSGTGDGIEINQDGNGISLDIDSEATTANGIALDITGTGTGLVVDGAGTGYSAIFNNGNVGIGITAPTALLHVQRGSGGTDPLFQVGTSTDSDIFVVKSNGNVGIGTTGPGTPLQISKDYGASYAINTPDTTWGTIKLVNSGTEDDGATGLSFVVDTVGNSFGGIVHTKTASGDGRTSIISSTDGGTTNVESLTVQHDGNVGIGTTTPIAELDLNSGNADNVWIRMGDITSTASKYIGTNDDVNFAAGNGFSGVEFGPTFGTGEGYLAFHTTDYGVGSGERMRIDKSGNVGIGTTGPNGKLEVSSGSSTTNDADIVLTVSSEVKGYTIGIDNDDSDKFKISDGLSVGANDRLTIDTSGNVGIGTTSPSQVLSVEGNVLADDYLEYSPAFVGDAITAIKGIKAEKDTEQGDWAKIDHNTLPEGVKVESQATSISQVGIEIIEHPSEYEDVFDEKTGTSTVLVKEEWIEEKPIMEETEYTFVGRSLGGSVQLNLKAIQQLIERVEALEAEKALGFGGDSVSELEARITELENRVGIIEKLINWIKNLF